MTILGQNPVYGWTMFEMLEGFLFVHCLVTVRHGHCQHFSIYFISTFHTVVTQGAAHFKILQIGFITVDFDWRLYGDNERRAELRLRLFLFVMYYFMYTQSEKLFWCSNCEVNDPNIVCLILLYCFYFIYYENWSALDASETVSRSSFLL